MHFSESGEHIVPKSTISSEIDLPAWDMPVSPLDQTFRMRIGGPLGTDAPSSLLIPTDSSSNNEDESSGDQESDDSDGPKEQREIADDMNIDISDSSSESNDSNEEEEDSEINEIGMDTLFEFDCTKLYVLLHSIIELTIRLLHPRESYFLGTGASFCWN